MITKTTSNLDELRRTFEEYVQFNHRDLELLRKNQLKNLLIKIRDEALRVAPTRFHIEAKVKMLGWRVVKKGTPEKWGSSAKRNLPKTSVRGMSKEDRRAELARRKMELAAMDEQTKMQNFVIRKRAHRIGFMSTAYILASKLLGVGFGKLPMLHAKKTQVSDDGTTTVIDAICGGIVDVDNRTGFVNRAIRETIADMRGYIETRMAAGRKRLQR